MLGHELKILIVCEHASAAFGGEAILPLHYFRILRARGIDVRLCAHDRTRGEVQRLFPMDHDRLHFVPDTALNKFTSRAGSHLPAQISEFTLGFISRLSTQRLARKIARRIVSEQGIDVIHQPIPVSPREPSLLHDMGAPVVIGPMNGNMSYPPAMIRRGQIRLIERFLKGGRAASKLLNNLFPGKIQASVLVVANDRTAAALPSGFRGEVVTLVENGVDLTLWSPKVGIDNAAVHATQFTFVGRLVDWKGVDLLLEAFSRARATVAPKLAIVGDGPMRTILESQARDLGIENRVRFHGWINQRDCADILRGSDALVLPSLYECGGAVVLEAMASSIPVIATDWGGPADYLDSSCGILIAPTSREDMIDGFAEAMERLAGDPVRRVSMGQAGRKKAEEQFDWDAKVDQMLRVYIRATRLK